MPISLDGLHPTLMRPRVEAVLADPEAVAMGLYVVSAYRSVARQTVLWLAAVAKYRSVAAARRWVAPPGRSNHGPRVDGYGTAVDFGVPGVKAVDGRWPAAIRARADAIWVRHGLFSPMAWEDWHAEPLPSFVTIQEAHMLVPGIVDTALVPGGVPDAKGRFPFWAVRADGAVMAFNGAPFHGPHTSLGTTAVIAIHARTDVASGYVLVTNDASENAGAATFAFPTS